MSGIVEGDCRDVVQHLSSDAVGAVVTDPPYDLLQASRGGSRRIHNDVDKPFGRHDSRKKGFMGAKWDATGVAFDPDTWAKIGEVMRPGAHILSFGGTRTFHRMACAIEDAGFEIRDTIFWLYGQGMPKHKAQLKPAAEPIVVARKPFKGSAKKCVEENGTGMLNVQDCLIGISKGKVLAGSVDGSLRRQDGTEQGFDPKKGRWPANVVFSHHEDCVQEGTTVVSGDQRDTGGGKRPGGFLDVGVDSGDGESNAVVYGDEQVGVWNCVEGCPVAELDRQSGNRIASKPHLNRRGSVSGTSIVGKGTFGTVAVHEAITGYGDVGGASRYFYCSKASRRERDAGLDEGCIHTTVKPIDLMRYLVRLVAPAEGLILDPFAGSGTTGIACGLEGVDFLGIEKESEYADTARRRIAHWAEKHDN